MLNSSIEMDTAAFLHDIVQWLVSDIDVIRQLSCMFLYRLAPSCFNFIALFSDHHL